MYYSEKFTLPIGTVPLGVTLKNYFQLKRILHIYTSSNIRNKFSKYCDFINMFTRKFGHI